MQSISHANGMLDASTLDPLPPVLKHGLMAVSFLGFLSFVSSSTLLCYLTLKLVTRHLRGQATKGCNQSLLPFYNLLIADIQQSLTFLLTVRWLAEDEMNVPISTCWVERWVVSTGDLACGVWTFAIALHTLFALTKGKTLPSSIFLSAIVGLWLFIYAIAVAGQALHRNGFYGRPGAWYWINEKYAFEGLWLHYFWIFVAIFGTIMLYTIIYTTLNARLRPESMGSSSSLSPLSPRVPAPDPPAVYRDARCMVIYPIIYVLCTLPLAAARIAAMTGHLVPYWYYCVASAAITSSGWLDVLVYAFTRRALSFSDAPRPVHECGLDTVGIFHSPEEFWSVRTVVEGGVLVDPTISTRRKRKKNKQNASLGSPYDLANPCEVMDDTFDVALPGTITTKTTVTITTEPRTATLNGSADQELVALLLTPSSKPDDTTLQLSAANTATNNGDGKDD